MAENPLKGLMSISVDRGTTATTDPESQQTCQPRYQAPLHGYRQGLRGCQEPRKWLTQVRCGSGSRTGREPGAGSGCASIIQAKVMRPQHSPENAARERSRVRNLRQAFHTLQAALPSVPPDTKLSKLDVLVLATNYIAHLTETLDNGGALAEHTLSSRPGGYLHPVKKWPMRSLLYCGSVGELLTGVTTNQTPLAVTDESNPLTPSPDAADSE